MSETKVIPASGQPHCPQCGTPLPSGSLAGLCPACLLRIGAATDTVTEGKAPFTPPSVAELTPLFPQLEILELIGKGGMGAVYKARQKQLDRIVALKILPPGIGNDAAFAERFAREAKALAKLNHPGIVTLFEFGSCAGLESEKEKGTEGAGEQQPPANDVASAPFPPFSSAPGQPQSASENPMRLYYFLMEFVDGVNLRQLLHAGRISAREALAIVPQICDALQFAHDQGIVHRDIKPENILLDRRGRVKVADFGLAKIVGGNEPLTPSLSPSDGERVAKPGEGLPVLTDAGKVMGTPQYMSPEQRDNPSEVDHRADIYALGVVFYQMLTGELPGNKIEAPSKKVQIDVRLDEVVLRALEKKPELRYQQASALKTQVETIAETPDPRSSGRESAQTEFPATLESQSRLTLAATGSTGFAVAVTFFYAGVILSILLVGLLPFRFSRDYAYLLGVGFMLVAAPFVGMAVARALREAQRREDQLRLETLGTRLKAGGIVAGLLALPVMGFALFFLFAMTQERGGWNPAVSEAVLVPLTWLGAVLLPISGRRLWQAATPSSAESQRPQTHKASRPESPRPPTSARKLKIVAALFILVGAWSLLDMLFDNGVGNVTIMSGALLLPLGFGLLNRREFCRRAAVWCVGAGFVFMLIMLGWLFGKAFGLFVGLDVVAKILGQPMNSAAGAIFTFLLFSGQVLLLPWMFLVLMRDDVRAACQQPSSRPRPFGEWAVLILVGLVMLGGVRVPLENRLKTGVYFTNLKGASTVASPASVPQWTDHRRLNQLVAPGSHGGAHYGDDDFNFDLLFNDKSFATTIQYRKEHGVEYRVQIEEKGGLRRAFDQGGVLRFTRSEGRQMIVEEKKVVERAEFDRIAAFVLQRKTDNPPVGQRGFAPVEERTVEVAMPPLWSWFDLDVGQSVWTAQEHDPEMDAADYVGWTNHPNADFCAVADGNRRGLDVGVGGCVLVPASQSHWDTLAAEHLPSLLAPFTNRAGSPRLLSERELPATLAFHSRAGNAGLLQITEFTEAPMGVKIRYKLVQTAKSGQGLEAPVPPEILPAQTQGEASLLQFRFVARPGETNVAVDLLPNPADSTGKAQLSVLREVAADGSLIAKAGLRGEGKRGQEIVFGWTESGQRRFAELTATNVGRQLAIVYDGRVLSAPVVASSIDSPTGVITGNFTAAEAERMVLALNRATAKSLRFEETQELVLPQKSQKSRTEATTVLLNLISHRWMTNPVSVGDERTFHEWLRRHGADLGGGYDARETREWLLQQNPNSVAEPEPIPLVFAYDAVVVPAATNAWGTATPTGVRYHWELMNQAADKQAIAGKSPSGNNTYYVRTRTDEFGLLQVLGFADNPRGVRVRYKLVQGEATHAMAPDDFRGYAVNKTFAELARTTNPTTPESVQAVAAVGIMEGDPATILRRYTLDLMTFPAGSVNLTQSEKGKADTREALVRRTIIYRDELAVVIFEQLGEFVSVVHGRRDGQWKIFTGADLPYAATELEAVANFQTRAAEFHALLQKVPAQPPNVVAEAGKEAAANLDAVMVAMINTLGQAVGETNIAKLVRGVITNAVSPLTTAASRTSHENGSNIVPIVITADGALTVAGQRYDSLDPGVWLGPLSGLHPTAVTISADAAVPFRQVTQITEACQSAGIKVESIRPAPQVEPPAAAGREASALDHSSFGSGEFQFRWVAAEDDFHASADHLADPNDRTGQTRLRVLKPVVLDEGDVESAGFSRYRPDQKELFVVLNPSGAQKFAAATAGHIGRRLAIVWNGRVISAPVLNTAITGGSVNITGRFTDAEAQQLLNVLNHRQPVAGASAIPKKGDSAVVASEHSLRVNRVNAMRQTLLAARMYADTNRGEWPVKVADLKPQLAPALAASVATELEYARPNLPRDTTYNAAAARTPVLFEAQPVDATGQCVGFADGHVEFIKQAGRLRQLRSVLQAGPTPAQTAELKVRIDAAESVVMFMDRDKILAAIARDAARIGAVEETRVAVSKMSSFMSRDDVICISARLLVAAGKKSDALELAQQISSFMTRDALIKELAQ